MRRDASTRLCLRPEALFSSAAAAMAVGATADGNSLRGAARRRSASWAVGHGGEREGAVASLTNGWEHCV